jgi:hypothetical protein
LIEGKLTKTVKRRDDVKLIGINGIMCSR